MAEKKKSNPTYKERYEQRIGRHRKSESKSTPKKAAAATPAPKKKEEKKSALSVLRDTLGMGKVSKQIKKAAKR